jgi:hypothetical protein
LRLFDLCLIGGDSCIVSGDSCIVSGEDFTDCAGDDFTVLGNSFTLLGFLLLLGVLAVPDPVAPDAVEGSSIGFVFWYMVFLVLLLLKLLGLNS